jgi:hypothetical protein
MEVATSETAPVVAVVKTEPIEVVNVANVNVANVANVASVASVTNVVKLRHSSRLERLELAKARKAITDFGKSLRKTEVIPEKEALLAANTENVIATDDTNMAEANPVQSVEQTIAEANAAIQASREFTAEFGDTPIDEFDD